MKQKNNRVKKKHEFNFWESLGFGLLVFSILLIIALAISLYWNGYHFKFVGDDWTEHFIAFTVGILGSFGSIAGIFFYYSAITLQKKELRMQRKEMKLQRKEFIESRKVSQKQADIFKLQSFQTSFYNYLEFIKNFEKQNIPGTKSSPHSDNYIFIKEQISYVLQILSYDNNDFKEKNPLFFLQKIDNDLEKQFYEIYAQHLKKSGMNLEILNSLDEATLDLHNYIRKNLQSDISLIDNLFDLMLDNLDSSDVINFYYNIFINTIDENFRSVLFIYYNTAKDLRRFYREIPITYSIPTSLESDRKYTVFLQYMNHKDADDLYPNKATYIKKITKQFINQEFNAEKLQELIKQYSFP